MPARRVRRARRAGARTPRRTTLSGRPAQQRSEICGNCPRNSSAQRGQRAGADGSRVVRHGVLGGLARRDDHGGGPCYPPAQDRHPHLHDAPYCRGPGALAPRRPRRPCPPPHAPVAAFTQGRSVPSLYFYRTGFACTDDQDEGPGDEGWSGSAYCGDADGVIGAAQRLISLLVPVQMAVEARATRRCVSCPARSARMRRAPALRCSRCRRSPRWQTGGATLASSS